jgi:hypothetical protein
VVDDSLTTQVGVTGVIVLLVLMAGWVARTTHRAALAQWQTAVAHRQELSEVQHELSELRAQHLELLLELRSLRADVAAAADETARSIQAAEDQRALMHDLLVPRQPVADPVYPSMHLPLVRAAFAADLTPRRPRVEPTAETTQPEGDDTGGSEPFPPKQLLDLTASEIARLRPAN